MYHKYTKREYNKNMQEENIIHKRRKNKMKTKEIKRRGTRGITLIALVVTIVVEEVI